MKTHPALTLIKRQLRAIDAEIQARIAAEKPLARTFEIIRSIPGPGTVSTAAVLAACAPAKASWPKPSLTRSGVSKCWRRWSVRRRRLVLAKWRNCSSAPRCAPRSTW